MQIETRTIDFIPEEERHGKPRDLFTVWFGANMNMTTLLTGALLYSLKLNLFWSSFATIIGVAVGSIFVASHSVQGPRLGIPQMIQSRAQFGVFGAILPMIFVMAIYFGFSVSNTLIVSQTLATAANISNTLSVVLFSVGTFMVALFGYQLIHKTQAILTWVSIVLFAVVLIIIMQNPPAADLWFPDATSLATVMMGIGLTSTFALSCAPYVADYSRYLPKDTSSKSVFWNTYFGMVLSLTFMMIIGAILASKIEGFADNSGGNLAALFGAYSSLLYILIVYALLCINVFNFYGAFMAVITTLEPIVQFKVTTKTRAFVLLLITLLNIGFCQMATGDFAGMFLNFIFFISYALVPWTAINLVDYYVVRKGKYNIPDIFNPNGIYGRYNGVAIAVFVASVLAEIPFINLAGFYTGPISETMGGIDLAWLVGIVVGSIGYYLPMASRVSRQDPIQDI